MPELPEVEVVRRGLAGHVVGRRIVSAEFLGHRVARRHVPGGADLSDRLRGNLVRAARRRGKYLWLVLAAPDGHEQALLMHLGMSGQLLVEDAGRPDERHLHARLEFADGGPQLRFVDQRTFGGLVVVAGGAALPDTIRHIARDPVDPDFDDAAFLAGLRRRRTGLKRALLDQSLISGVGNIYADESLWRARLHYARPTETLNRPEGTRVLAGIRSVMDEALTAGGTSFDRLYVSTEGASGLFERRLAVYGRAGEPCLRCGTPVRRDAFMNRSSFWCPACQPRPRRARL